MTQEDINRNQICLEIKKKHITQKQASIQLNITLRQMQRIYHAFKKHGLQGIVSKKKGKKSNHQLNLFIKSRILELVTCDLYKGFGPTYMCETLNRRHNIDVSVETIRQLMIQSQVWHGKKEKSPIIHQQRKRRAHSGELLQIDGSPHAWFEDRREPCILIVFIDDATGQTFGQFFETETTFAYMTTLRKYIMQNGKPLAIYSDKYSVFRINHPGCLKKDCTTQFGRVLKELEIELIYANSPQAKGRVERANQTLQDRLVKELRLAQINTIKAANQFLETYWKEYNTRFQKKALQSEDYHRILSEKDDLDNIICIKEKRKVSKNLEFQYKNVIYQIENNKANKHLIRAEIEIFENLSGQIISINYKGKSIQYHEYAQQETTGMIVDSKEIDDFLKEKHKRKRVNSNHPWNQQGRAEAQKKQYFALETRGV